MARFGRSNGNGNGGGMTRNDATGGPIGGGSFSSVAANAGTRSGGKGKFPFEGPPSGKGARRWDPHGSGPPNPSDDGGSRKPKMDSWDSPCGTPSDTPRMRGR